MGNRFLQLASIAAGVVVAAASAAPFATSVQPASAATTTTSVSAKALLTGLTTARESHGDTYSRARFGAWVDADKDCADTRAEVLRAESTRTVTANSACTVRTGGWKSKYDGKSYTAATYLDIDHLVPLKEAWTSGAYRWTAAKRKAYANDLGYAASLIAVSVHANRAKSDQEPTTWLPAARGYRCTYLRNWIAVKARWGLTVNAAERTVLSRGLAKYCTSYKVTKPGTPRITALIGSGSGSSTTSPPKPSTTTDRRYSTCTAAKAAHAHTPYYRGTDPEYAWYTDRDHDGVACE